MKSNRTLLLLAVFVVIAESPCLSQTAAPGKGTAAPAAKPAGNYDGTWTGTTSQYKEISFTIKDGAILHVSLVYTIPGGRCFPIRDSAGNAVFLETLNNSLDTKWTIPRKAPKVTGNTFKLQGSPNAGGADAAPLYTIRSKFEADGSLSGTIALTAVQTVSDAYPNPPCTTSAKASFKATRKPQENNP